MSTHKSIDDRQDRLIRELNAMEDWMDKYAFLIERGKRLKPMDPALKTENHAIAGCQSSVWMISEMVDGAVFYCVDSNALITKGLSGLLLDVLNGSAPGEIIRADLYFIEKTGLQSHLSPSRATGLISILAQMKRLASEYLKPD